MRYRVGRMHTVNLSTIEWMWALWKKVWALLGPAGNVVQWVYSVNGRFHSAIKRTWFWLANTTAHWDASLAFELPHEGGRLPDVLGRVVQELSHQPGFQILRDMPHSKVVRARGIVLDLSCASDVLHIQVADQIVSFRESKKILNSQLLPLAEVVEEQLRGARKRYSLTARFGAGENPYLAVYLRRINKDLINTFQCTYNLGQGNQGVTFSVNLDSISLVAESRERFREESLKLLALSHP